MNGRSAKKLRRHAEKLSIGQPTRMLQDVTRVSKTKGPCTVTINHPKSMRGVYRMLKNAARSL